MTSSTSAPCAGERPGQGVVVRWRVGRRIDESGRAWASILAVLLSYCVVNTNGREFLLACLEAIERTTPPDLEHEILVLDNASDDGSADAVRAALGRRDPADRARPARGQGGQRQPPARRRRAASSACCSTRTPSSSPGRCPLWWGRCASDRRAAAAGAQLLSPDGRPVPCAWRLPSVGDRAGRRALPASPVHGRERRRGDPPGRLGAVERDAGPPRGRARRSAGFDPRLLRLLRRDRLLQAPLGRRLADPLRALRPGPSTTTRWPRTPPGPSGGSSSTTATATATCASTSAGCGRSCCARCSPGRTCCALSRPWSSRATPRAATGCTPARRCCRAAARASARPPRRTTGRIGS